MTSYTWTAIDGGNWNNAADWTPTGTPGAADSASFATGGNLYTVSGNASVSAITVDADNVTFAGALTIDGAAA